MPELRLPFGTDNLALKVPDANFAEVLCPSYSRPLEDLDQAIAEALDNPIGAESLAQLIKSGQRVLIVSDDNTRLTPVNRILPPLLKRLNHSGISDNDITVIMALGTHRYMTKAEKIEKVGSEIYKRVRVINHKWRDETQLVDLGKSRQGTPLIVNKAVMEHDVLIGLGAIVPHHIPGFSGSSKIIQPGICGPATTAATHLLACSKGGDSFLGILDNPVREDMDDMADRVNLNIIFNVVMNSEGSVVGVFFGEKRLTFSKGVKLAKGIYGVEYHETPDIVVSNAYPCELDFWQSHKAQYPAQRIIKNGGTIILCTPAPEGVSPVHTELLNFTSWSSRKILRAYQSGELNNGVATALALAWAVVREKASVIMYSPGIPPQDKERLGQTHAPDLNWALNEAFQRQGQGARVTVLTHAPDILPIKAP